MTGPGERHEEPYPPASAYGPAPGLPPGAGPYSHPYYPPAQAEPSTLAVAALVLGILSLTGCSCFTGVPAMICGRAYMKKNLPENRSLAQVGFWLGVVSTALGVLAVLVYGSILAFGLAGGFEDLPNQH
nr:DUF4190 domain-containing protein [Segniliparus rotundus]